MYAVCPLQAALFALHTCLNIAWTNILYLCKEYSFEVLYYLLPLEFPCDSLHIIYIWLPYVHPEFFSVGGRAESEAMYNTCLILNIMFQKLCLKCNCNITLFAIAFMYSTYKCNYMTDDSVPKFKSPGLILVFLNSLFHFSKF